jgi:hypothetical protein
MMLLKREKCKNPSADVDICEKYVTTFQTTGIPLIIGLTLVEPIEHPIVNHTNTPAVSLRSCWLSCLLL